MSEVLVVVDHVDGEVKKPTYELLTIARRLGEPSAVFFGSPDKGDAVAEKVKAYGAEKVYVVDDAGRVASMKAFWEPERPMASLTTP
jgi:electron transfer flavoprotein alpha subunit